jgi:PAS domain S-box-containing protein
VETDLQHLLHQNRLLTEEVKRRIDQLAAINTVAATVSQSLDLNLTLQTALRSVLNVVGAEAGGISLIDEKTSEVVLRAQYGWPHDFVNPPMRIPLGHGMSGQVIATNDVVVNNNLDGTEPLAVPRFHEENFRSIVMAPMHARGKIIGILSIMGTQPNRFSSEIIGMLKAVADTVGVAIDNARLYESTSERQKQLQAILNSTADGIIATNQKGQITVINHAAESLFDTDAILLMGHPLRDVPIQSAVRDPLLYALESKRETYTFQVTLDKGKMLSLTMSPITVEQQVSEGSTYEGWVIVIRDISHLREAELRRAEFMRTAAHDMKNPLSVTLSSLHMLRDYFDVSDPNAIDIIRIAINGVQRLQGLINDLLHLEQLEIGYGIKKSPLEIGSLIREVIDSMAPLVTQQGLQCRVDLAQDIPQIEGDAQWIRRAVENYLDNAIKYIDKGKQITVRAFVETGRIHIEVTDDGPGIPLDAQARLFERFYRATSEKTGSGLGLAIVKSVAEAHGGSVYVRSEPNKGSTFGLTLAWTHIGDSTER